MGRLFSPGPSKQMLSKHLSSLVLGPHPLRLRGPPGSVLDIIPGSVGEPCRVPGTEPGSGVCKTNNHSTVYTLFDPNTGILFSFLRGNFTFAVRPLKASQGDLEASVLYSLGCLLYDLGQVASLL